MSGVRVVLLTAVLAWLAAPLPAAAGGADVAKKPPVGDAIKLLDLWIEEQRAYRELPGLAVGVVVDQELIWSRGFGVRDLETGTPMTPKTAFRVASITKLFTATAVMQLRDRGLLRLDDPVVTHLPWFSVQSPFAGEPEITVRHLLTHTAGLTREAAFPYWTTHDFPTREQIIAALPEQSAVFAPATTYKYSNLGMALLGEIVATVSGKPWAAYVDEHILGPLGMDDSGAAPGAALRGKMTMAYLRRKEDGGREIADYYETRGLAPAAQLVSTVEDLARFAALQFRKGSDDGSAPVLKASTVREMHRPHWIDDDWDGGRGLGFGISRRGGKTLVSHGGWVAGHRSHLLLSPAEKIAVIVMTNADDGSPTFFSYRIYDTLAPAIQAATAPPPAEKKADPAWQQLVGTYSDPWGWEYRVMVLDDELVMYGHSYPPDDEPDGGLTRLEPDGDLRFRMADGEHVVFELGDDGEVQRIRRRYEFLYPGSSGPPPDAP